MNALDHMSANAEKGVLFRAASHFDVLKDLFFNQNAGREWATFARFGWRDTPDALVVTLAGLAPPAPGEVDGGDVRIALHAPYILKTALAAERHDLAVGVIHSHPTNAPPVHSETDDDMDAYFSRYFDDFAPGRPYVSLILSEMQHPDKQDAIAISGRVYWKGQWRYLQRTAVAREPAIETWTGARAPSYPPVPPERVARFTSAFGKEAYQRLRRSTVSVIGAGGTGSAAIPMLARAGVGRIVIVDSDFVSESNLERMHASWPEHAARKTPKALVAMEHVRRIDPDIEVDALIGRLPQKEIVDAVVASDIVLGCTDRHSSRLALSDLSTRYLVPAIDSGGLIEGRDGAVTGQIAQFVRFFPDDACVRCRDMVNLNNVKQELRATDDWARFGEAEDATDPIDGEFAPRLPTEAQIDTVGYMTTVMGAMSAGYAIGWLTGRFDAPFERMQMNFVAPCLDVTDRRQERRADCVCGLTQGFADQAGALAYPIPVHWPPVRRLDAGARRDFAEAPAAALST